MTPNPKTVSRTPPCPPPRESCGNTGSIIFRWSRAKRWSASSPTPTFGTHLLPHRPWKGGAGAGDRLVREAMRTEVWSVTPEDSVEDALLILTGKSSARSRSSRETASWDHHEGGPAERLRRPPRRERGLFLRGRHVSAEHGPVRGTDRHLRADRRRVRSVLIAPQGRSGVERPPAGRHDRRTGGPTGAPREGFMIAELVPGL